METIKNASLCFVAGLLLNWLSSWLASDFLATFLGANLITLLIALLAINTTTISVIMTKLRDLSSDPKAFAETMAEMKTSVVEQMVLIALAVLLQILTKSTSITWLETTTFVLNSLVAAVFVYALHILWDTANGVFIILKYESKKP